VRLRLLKGHILVVVLALEVALVLVVVVVFVLIVPSYVLMLNVGLCSSSHRIKKDKRRRRGGGVEEGEKGKAKVGYGRHACVPSIPINTHQVAKHISAYAF
jgi:hypothetical protein